MRSRTRVLCWLAAAYAGFVLYGSLMPWQFRPLDFESASAAYLGLASQRQWVFSYRDAATNLGIALVLGLLASACLGSRSRRPPPWLALALVVGACSLFSASIEWLQLYVPERTSSVHDWAANTFGSALGAGLWEAFGARVKQAAGRTWRLHAGHDAGSAALRRLVKLGALPYLLLLCGANHWFSLPGLGWHEAVQRAAQVNLLPFFYHQQASTAVALTSVAWQAFLYALLGAGLRTLTSPPGPARPWTPAAAAAVGAAVAAVLEGGRLFVAGQHPDTGNMVVAALATAGAFAAWPVVLGMMRAGSGPPTESATAVVATLPQPAGTPPALPPAQAAGSSTWVARALSIVLLAASAAAWWRFPVLQGPLGVALLVYAGVLLRWPQAWMWVLPAALPVLDLAPLSGWFFFDEFDLAVLVTLAVSLWRAGAAPRRWPSSSLAAWAWAAFAVSVVLSTVVGLLPWQALDANADASELSHYNALRIAKGFAWGCTLVWLFRRAGGEPAAGASRLTAGIVAGLAGATLLAVWERAAYPGLLDFDSVHRVGAFFSSMHNGGSHIEATLVLGVPFLLVAGYGSRSMAGRLAAAALFVAVTYVLLVTFGRGGYAAYLLTLMLAAGLLWHAARRGRGAVVLAWSAAGAAAVAALAVWVFAGTFAQQRLGTTAADLQVRTAHWREAVRIRDPGWSTELFGMGLGRFPETYLYRSQDRKDPATFRYLTEGGVSHLELGSGRTVYVEQFVDLQPNRSYRLALDLRSPKGPAKLNVLLCARTYFVSYGCESATFSAAPGATGWLHQEAVIQSHALGAGPWRRPVKLSLENATRGTTLDVRKLELNEPEAANLVRNGDFSAGHDHWFFSSNFNHLPWHVKNLWLGLFFDQGWFGVTSFTLALGVALAGLSRAAWGGSAYAAAALAATVGFLCVGLFDSLFDAPRLTTLFLLVAGAFGAPAAAAAAAFAPAARPASAMVPGRPFVAGRAGLAVAALALAIALVTHLPGIPYELRALPNPYHPVAAPVLLAVLALWVAGLPALAARWLQTGRAPLLLFPLAVAGQAVLAWALTRQAVLPAMIHKVAGAPVLGWPWEWETMLRYCALQAAIFVLLTGGSVVARSFLQPAPWRALGVWAAWAACLLPPLHYVIVTRAATDNLTELMAGGGGLVASSMIGLWLLALGAAGAMFGIGAPAARRGSRLRLPVAALSVALGYALLSAGLESGVQKYGVTFSALQFVLSADRQHYAGPWELALRYVAMHAGLIALIALAQFPFRGAAAEAAPPERLRESG